MELSLKNNQKENSKINGNYNELKSKFDILQIQNEDLTDEVFNIKKSSILLEKENKSKTEYIEKLKIEILKLTEKANENSFNDNVMNGSNRSSNNLNVNSSVLLSHNKTSSINTNNLNNINNGNNRNFYNKNNNHSKSSNNVLSVNVNNNNNSNNSQNVTNPSNSNINNNNINNNAKNDMKSNNFRKSQDNILTNNSGKTDFYKENRIIELETKLMNRQKEKEQVNYEE